MHLTERERERLLIAAGADLARRRLARRAPLGAAEAIALVCDEILEWAWDGVPYEEVVQRARDVVPREALLPQVPALVPIVQVEALFPYGSVLVHVAQPFGPPDADGPGSVRPGTLRRELAPGRRRERVEVTNGGHAPVWISSHVPLDSLNAAIHTVTPPGRWRLDSPAGVSTRVESGATVALDAVEILPTAGRDDDGGEP